MTKFAFCVLLVGAVPPALLCQQSLRPIAITHVNVIDVVAGVVRADQTVVLANGNISAVGLSSSVEVPREAVIFVAAGQYLIPGLWDMHVHLRSDAAQPGTRLAAENEAMLDLFLPNGIVGICEMGGDLADHVIRWRDEIRAGKREGPRILTAGRKIDNDPTAWPGSIGVKTTEEARQAVDLNQGLGADFIKIYFRNTSSEVLRAVVDEAHRLHLKVTGHKPGNLSLQEFIDTGVDGFQHAEYLPAAPREAFDSLVRERTRRNSTPWAMDANEFNARFFSLEDPAEDARLYERMAREKLWVTPTLSVETHVLEHGTRDYESDERKRYIPPAIWRSWDPKLGRRSPLEPRALALRKAAAERWQKDAIAAFKAGVPMTLGTDCGADNDHVMPGWSVHEELEALVHAGLTPAEALRLATTNAAAWRGDTNQGEIAKGKVADLVLLRSNPLTDIRHAAEIDAVFQAGRHYSRADLDAMLARSAERARTLH
jgi:imidazolonepropionase-like amidohydrolase